MSFKNKILVVYAIIMTVLSVWLIVGKWVNNDYLESLEAEIENCERNKELNIQAVESISEDLRKCALEVRDLHQAMYNLDNQ